MKLTIILSVCFLAFAETSQRQSGSLLRKTEPEARKGNVIKNSRIPAKVQKFMTAVGESASSASANKEKALSIGQSRKVVTSILSPRIIGGENTDVGKWPWQAMILRKLKYGNGYYFTCGGSLIGKQWVLSAAHCFNTTDPSQIKIVLGAPYFLDLSNELTEKNVNMTDVSAVLCHKDYSNITLENDICLVELASKVQYTTNISSIRLPSSSDDNVTVGQTCVITGWGDTQEDGESSSILQQAYIEVFSIQNCKDWYAEDNRTIPDDDICAGTIDASKGGCYGDSGGPLACNRSDGGVTSPTLYGVTSFGSLTCTKRERPTLFTGVVNYLDWINETKTKGVKFCYSLSSVHSCGSVIKENYSRIRSPIADNTSWLYPGDVDCSWTIQAPAGYVVKIEFLCYFDTGNDCQDYLEINSTNGRGPEARKENVIKNSRILVVVQKFMTTVGKSASSVSANKKKALSNGQYDKVVTSISNARIIGGENADLGKWPWQAMILAKNGSVYSFTCGGSLIGSQWVLSAAHCFHTRDPSQTKIALGAHYLHLSGKNWKKFAVSAVLCHPNHFDRNYNLVNDICLVKLASEVQYTNYISPIRFPSSSEDNVIVEETCVNTGWGDTQDGGERSLILQQAYVEVFSNQNCID